MDEKTAHLGMIQTVIERMARCSFLLRGWAVTLVSAIFALAARDADPSFIIVAYIPTVAFWILDGYYLYQERLFRALYNDVAAAESSKGFSMDTRPFDGQDRKHTWAGASFSKTPLIFYGAVIGVTLLVMFAVIPSMAQAN